MNEEINLKNNVIKHMAYNIIAFAIILSIFAGFMFLIIKTVTYARVDEELYSARDEILEWDMMNSEFYYDIFPNILNNEIVLDIKDRIKNNVNSLAKKVSNPKVNMIIWDENGNIVIEFGRISEYEDSISINKNQLDQIYQKNVTDNYHYRAINFKIDYNDDNIDDYCQLLINVDTEMYLVRSYFEIIVAAVIVGIICSILASYILSKKTLKPIANNMRKHTEFIQNVSHELRTPLTIIQAKQELMLSDPDAKIVDKIEDISITLEETKRLTKLTKDLLILTRADNKNMSIQKEPTNVDEFLSGIIKNYTELAEMQNKTIKMTFNCSKEINIDRTKIHQLMVILIDNAIKYTEERDEIEIATGFKDNKCVIVVRDTGIGVSDEGLERIFERFYRDDKARNRETGGTGLGLSIASTIVSAHNGTIKAMHNEPKGTAFIIKLPK